MLFPGVTGSNAESNQSVTVIVVAVVGVVVGALLVLIIGLIVIYVRRRCVRRDDLNHFLANKDQFSAVYLFTVSYSDGMCYVSFVIRTLEFAEVEPL